MMMCVSSTCSSCVLTVSQVSKAQGPRAENDSIDGEEAVAPLGGAKQGPRKFAVIGMVQAMLSPRQCFAQDSIVLFWMKLTQSETRTLKHLELYSTSKLSSDGVSVSI